MMMSDLECSLLIMFMKTKQDGGKGSFSIVLRNSWSL